MYNVICMDWTVLVLIKHTKKQHYDGRHVPKGQKKTQPKHLKLKVLIFSGDKKNSEIYLLYLLRPEESNKQIPKRYNLSNSSSIPIK